MLQLIVPCQKFERLPVEYHKGQLLVLNYLVIELELEILLNMSVLHI